MLSQATAVLVTFAACVASKFALFRSAFGEERALAGTPVTVLNEALVTRPAVLIHRHVVEGILFY